MQIGVLIRKRSFGLFHPHLWGERWWCRDNYPTIYVNKLRIRDGNWVINEKHLIQQNAIDSIVEISEDEAEFLNREWDKIKNIKIPNGEACVTGDTKEPKKKLDEERAIEILFQYRQKYPEKNFELYRCLKCGGLHLGKKKINPIAKGLYL